MNTTINGLHSCKPGNEPIEGDVKTFVIEQKTSKAGKPWLKIKSAGPDYGGTPHRILSAEKTDFVDQHGNVSYNVEIEPVDGAQNAPPTPSAPRQGAFAPRESQHTAPKLASDVDSARRHIMQAANLLLLCKRAADSVLGDSCDPEDGRSLFIDASRAGFIHAMPDNKMVETRQTAEPFTATETPTTGADAPW